MTLLEVIPAGGDAEVLDAHLAFHLGAGVDVVLVSGGMSADVDDVLGGVRRSRRPGRG